MMRPQVRVLFTLLISILLTGMAAHGQTLLPFVIDASGEVQETQTVAEESDAGMTAAPVAEKGDSQDVAEEGDKGQAPADAEEQGASEEAAPPEPKKPAKPPLSPEMAAFRDQVRRTLSQVYSRSLSAQNNLPAEVLAFSRAFGHTAEIFSGGRSNQKINAVGAVCWNYPCGGYKLLRTDGKQIVARVGYGYQERPAQLLAVLALNRVPDSYELRIGDHRGTIANLIASEKLACRKGLDQSQTLIGLAFYAAQETTWKNDLGEKWSVERLLAEELNRKVDASRIDVIDRLMGISYALNRLDEKKVPTKGLIDRCRNHVEQFQDFTLGLQNDDGTWNPGFLAYRGTSKDATGSLFSTGAVLTWLVYSLPEERLEDERVVRGLAYLNKQLAYGARRRTATPSTSQDMIGQMNAARAISLYDVRYFTPRTPEKPVEESEAKETAATGATAVNRSVVSRH